VQDTDLDARALTRGNRREDNQEGLDMTRISAVRLGASIAAIAAASAFSGQARAAAFYLQEQSIKANGRAWSGEVSERGAQQQWWNPAAVGGVTGLQAYGGLTALLPKARSANIDTRVIRPGIRVPGVITVPASNTAVGGDQVSDDPVNNGFLPNGGFAVPLGRQFAFGLTVTSPYSFTTNYDATSWARYNADKTRLRTYDIQPVIAFSPTPSISIGAGPNIEYTKATLSNYLPDPLSGTFPDGRQSLKGDGWDVGYSVGFQFHNDKVDLGMSYKSAIRHKLKGTLAITGLANPLAATLGLNRTIEGARADFSTPWQVNVGGRYHVTPQWTLNAQVSRFGWSRFKEIALLAPINQVIPEKYKNSFSYSLGTDYQLTPALTLRAGVQRDLSPLAIGERDPRVPDGNRWNFAGGASYELTEHMGLDASVNYTKIASNPIDKTTAAFAGTALQTVILTNGTLGRAHAWVLGAGAHMAF
jgi:long-chain fatty acid transport protein